MPALPYRLPELIEAIAVGCAILVVEGEAKVDQLRSWNIPATCCAGGAKKWRAEHSAFLRGANVVILPDNDDVGRAHMNVVAASLQGVAASIRVLELPDLPPKGDIVDWARSGGTAEQLHKLIDGAPHWRPAFSLMNGADIAIEFAQKVGDEVDEDAVFERLGSCLRVSSSLGKSSAPQSNLVSHKTRSMMSWRRVGTKKSSRLCTIIGSLSRGPSR